MYFNDIKYNGDEIMAVNITMIIAVARRCKGTAVIASCLTLASLVMVEEANAAIALDRTRVIFNGAEKSLSLNITNQNKQLPYLAQAWIEDDNGRKIDGPLIVLPPLQRVEPGAKSQIKVQADQSINLLAQDRESLYYFNVREIPPKSNKPNTLQIALQTRIKLFYRPAAIAISSAEQSNPYQSKLTLTRQGDSYIAHNPTPYYVTVANIATGVNMNPVKGFTPMMIPPKSSALLGKDVSRLGSKPVMTYINDYGGRPKLVFSCSTDNCIVERVDAG